jgi:hypothetical protein
MEHTPFQASALNVRLDTAKLDNLSDKIISRPSSIDRNPASIFSAVRDRLKRLIKTSQTFPPKIGTGRGSVTRACPRMRKSTDAKDRPDN